jgi:hypothetical protein
VMRLSISGNELDGWSYDIEQIGTLAIEEVESGGDGVVRRPRPLRTFNLDPAGGTCSGRTSVWNVSRRGSIPLPSATDCTKDGYVLLGWTRDPAKIAPEYLLHTTVSRGGPVIAVWGRLPSKPTVAFALPDFLCQGCGTALVAWQTPDTDTTGFVLLVDGRPTGCTAFAIGDWWLCAVQALTSGQPHTFEIAARNTNGAGPPITAI